MRAAKQLPVTLPPPPRLIRPLLPPTETLTRTATSMDPCPAIGRGGWTTWAGSTVSLVLLIGWRNYTSEIAYADAYMFGYSFPFCALNLCLCL